ncbi:MAG: PIG-L deacetylase family protein [Armatimonadota bacterium]
MNTFSKDNDTITVGVIVAHPDDETLWAGGTLLLHPEWRCRIVTLCRGNDADRAPRFGRVLARYGAEGRMADIDDGPEQLPLPDAVVADTILRLVDGRSFDLLYTHGPQGEYTRHRRHEETSRTVTDLWRAGLLPARELRLFAYTDDDRTTFPHACADADVQTVLPPEILAEKRRIVHEIYGFTADSWEARATPAVEAFWNFTSPEALKSWLRIVREEV